MPRSGIGRAQKRREPRAAFWQRTGSTRHGRPLTRRSSLAVAAVLATMALTASAGDGLAPGSTSTRYAALPVTPSAAPTATPSPTVVPAVEASTEVATAVQAASEALSEAQYVTTEAPVDTAARDQITRATSALRDLVVDARTKPVLHDRTATTPRTGERSPVPEATGPTTTAADAAAAVAETAVAVETGTTPAVPVAPVVEALTVPDEAGEAPDQIRATATGTPEETDPASDIPPTADEAAIAIQEATAALNALLDTTPVAAVSVTPAPPTPEEIAAQRAAAAAAEAQARAARLAELASATAGYANGRIPVALLCELSFAPGERLRCDAADQLERLNVAFAARFGRNLTVVDSYRSYGAQVATKTIKPDLAAVPGTSEHGLGLAVDLSDGLQSYGTAKYEWMRANAPAFGWDNPDWARAAGTKNEPWHWEYDLP
ncbi:D-alanyl-D-alanine carboxypeptidase family protein [Antribacter sp. KLBMP9083]|uniref:D-alanyl-D-alanine carboxypeptidase family protein n=1 Tax=Antribacter soli TaxID=2910976 RepID=A0AA41QDK3_9MICO|nr:D-alanyl-D-alanine carboxypeptidase family protein [Antribacter soli]MCF4121495.1 D-alanyl-D-alanine carboxypeptidase family protein [Antribacter soli]